MALFSSTKPPTKEQVSALVESMPPLAGHPLEAPKLFKTRWRVGQRFTSRDDPDRTQEVWHPPEFLCSRDPKEQSSRTQVEELQVPRAGEKRFARVVRNVLDQKDCATLLTKVNDKGFTPALVNVGMDRQQLMPEVRDGHRIIVDSKELVAWLLEVLRPHLPAELPNGLRLAGLNERCRFLCYTPGQMFEEHRDGCYRRPMGHPEAGDRSMITVQLYLHDVPASYGGATTFFPGTSHSVWHQPEAGSVLLFTQDLDHEGSLLKEGLKYTLRTEAMYTSRGSNAHLQRPLSSATPCGFGLSDQQQQPSAQAQNPLLPLEKSMYDDHQSVLKATALPDEKTLRSPKGQICLGKSVSIISNAESSQWLVTDVKGVIADDLDLAKKLGVDGSGWINGFTDVQNGDAGNTVGETSEAVAIRLHRNDAIICISRQGATKMEL